MDYYDLLPGDIKRQTNQYIEPRVVLAYTKFSKYTITLVSETLNIRWEHIEKIDITKLQNIIDAVRGNKDVQDVLNTSLYFTDSVLFWYKHKLILRVYSVDIEISGKMKDKLILALEEIIEQEKSRAVFLNDILQSK